jgi:hypothetical protein
MNYELAKQLKDAGFPQLGNVTDKTLHSPSFHPTLSELIEACYPKSGEEFALIVEFNGGYKTSIRYWDIDSQEYFAIHEEIGTTAEEATGKLWLALNQK